MAKPTAAEVKRYVFLLTKRRELERQARLLQSESDKLEESIAAFVRGQKKPVTLCGYIFSMLTRAGRVSWKDELIKAVGVDKVEQLQATALPTTYLHFESAE